jgi:hypothetical protein
VTSLREYPPSTRLALYRRREPISEEQKRDAVSFLRRKAEGRSKYNYWGVIKVFLRNRLRIPMTYAAPSVSDLLYSNNLRLIDFI